MCSIRLQLIFGAIRIIWRQLGGFAKRTSFILAQSLQCTVVLSIFGNRSKKASKLRHVWTEFASQSAQDRWIMPCARDNAVVHSANAAPNNLDILGIGHQTANARDCMRCGKKVLVENAIVAYIISVGNRSQQCWRLRTVGALVWSIATHRFSSALHPFIDFVLEPVTACLWVYYNVNFRDDGQDKGPWNSILQNKEEAMQFVLYGLCMFNGRILASTTTMCNVRPVR